jgi:hypothetical protein
VFTENYSKRGERYVSAPYEAEVEVAAAAAASEVEAQRGA